MNSFKTFFSLIISVSLLALVRSSSDSFSNDPVIKAWLEELNEDYSGDNEIEADPIYPTVHLKNGTVRGQMRYTGTTKINRFLGIPFAKPPINELRFQPPQPHEGWGNKTLKATRHPKACMQFLTNLTPASEDCLYLSIYTRRIVNDESDKRLLPVIVWIHGGGFVFGQNSYYTGQKLLKQDEVVLVSIQYRLGPLGFFSTGDDTVSANNGMKDMVQALRWVQENIEPFGGDPNSVTVMGESAGSASALYMLISPLARGLFHRVVAMSGSPLQEWALDRNPQETSKRIGKLLQCPTGSSVELVNCMKGKKPLGITRAGLAIIMEDLQNFEIYLRGSTPVIEGDVPGAFLPDDPLKLFLEGPLPDVPVLLGAVQHEGILPFAGAHFLILEPQGLLNDSDYMRDFLLGDMLKTYGVNEHRDGASVSQALALGFLPPDADRAVLQEYQYELLDALSVVFMKAPILRTASILSRRISSVYLYSFEYYSKNSLYHLAFLAIELLLGGTKPPGLNPGICHADDLMYMFRLPFILSEKDQAFSKTYVKLFTNFVSHGNPTPETTNEYPLWLKYDDKGKHYLRMSDTFEVKRDYTASWRQGVPGYSSRRN